MTELEYKIQTLESAIRTVARSIARPKNSRQREADVRTLARLQKELEELKNKQDAQPEAMEPLPGDEEKS